jgi:two-component system sensor histidine kinase MprB
MRVVGNLASTLFRAVRTSLRYRLVLMTTLTIVAATAISGFGTYQAARLSMYDQLDRELLSIAENIATQISLDVEENRGLATATLDSENVLAFLVQASGVQELLLGDQTTTVRLDYHEVAVARIQTGNSARNDQAGDGLTYRLVAVPFIDAPTQTAYALVVARDLAPTYTGLSTLAAMQLAISAVAVLLCLGAAVLVAAATLNPIQDLTSVVSQVTSTDELKAIRVHGASEVADLERSFNVMMESLAASHKLQDRLIADAGHELRTPLTSLRTNIELLIADEKSTMLPPDARSAILSDVAAQLGEFTSLVNDLVSLSRGMVTPNNFLVLDFSEVVERAVNRAERRGPSLFFDVILEPIYVMGDATTLERAVTNLLDNAVKFSPPAGRVTVRLDARGLMIADQGPGIPDEAVPHIFERFYRADTSRNTPGTGLGLSIVDHTIAIHGGTIAVSRAESGGAKFLVRLPQVAPEQWD